MDAVDQPVLTEPADAPEPPGAKKRRSRARRWLRRVGFLVAGLIVILIVARLMLPSVLRWYVNRTINQSEMYEGRIGAIRVHLYRGAYSIEDVRILKTSGNVPVPLFAADRVDFALEWNALLKRKIVGRVVMERAELNFVDNQSSAGAQTGAGTPWLNILKELFPFKINSAVVHRGSIHFRAFDTKPPVDVYLSQVEASIENLTNINDEITPLIATVKAEALAMDQARLQYQMKLNPFSYRPTFELAVRLLALDVTKTNALARAYGDFDFEKGWFDLVVELKSQEGAVEGYVKPIFRDLKVLSLRKDIREDNVLNFFWETLVGATAELLKNQPRNQFATLVPLRGTVEDTRTDILVLIGNVLRNAFIRAYLPRLEGTTSDIDGLQFGKASVTDPSAVGPN